MEKIVDSIQKMKIVLENERKWRRYVNGDIIYDMIDEKNANDLQSYVSDPENSLSLEETHKFLDFGLSSISSESVGHIDENWFKRCQKVQSVLWDARESILYRWTKLLFENCGSENNKNEFVQVLEHVTLSFWRSSAERKGKIIFFPSIHIEVVPFLQSIRVIQYHEIYMSELHRIMQTYPLEYLYNYVVQDNADELEDEGEIPSIKLEIEKSSKKAIKKKTLVKKGLTNTIEMALKTGEKRKKHKKPLSQRVVISRSPSLKRDEKIKSSLYSDVKPIWKTSAPKERATDGSEHHVDFVNEVFLGPVYHISSFECGKRAQKFGSWSISLETDLVERKLSGESIQVSLKVPVEEVFLGSNEPVVAFCEENSKDWKKGVFTTHTQFDQNTFIVSTRLSKLGYISLFQHSDFHYPYKKWYINFEKDVISVRLHTNVVELAFILEGVNFHLDTLTGDEFSKLRNLHQKKMSLSEMIIKLEKHGVHIVPNEETINKHRDTKKELGLEIYTYRLICLKQIDCESCRMNGTVSNETVVLTIDGSPKYVSTKNSGNYYENFGEHGKKRTIHTNNLTPATLFQFLMVTRPLVVTK